MRAHLIKWFATINKFLIRITCGWSGAKLGMQTILLLHIKERKSGKMLITPIPYFLLDGNYFVMASSSGKKVQASWHHNLLAAPRTVIEVQGKTISVDAREVRDDEYEHLWKYAIERHPAYLDYQKMTDGHIPIIVFVPYEG